MAGNSHHRSQYRRADAAEETEKPEYEFCHRVTLAIHVSNIHRMFSGALYSTSRVSRIELAASPR
jgi:hypothetical protein